MFTVEVDSLGPIFDIVQAQIYSPQRNIIEVGRKGEMFTISVSAKKDANGLSGDVQLATNDIESCRGNDGTAESDRP